MLFRSEKPILEEMNSIEMIRDSSDELSSSDSEILTPPVRVKDSDEDYSEIEVQDLQVPKPVVRNKSSRKRISYGKSVLKNLKSSGTIQKKNDSGSGQSIVDLASDVTNGERSEFEAFEIRRAARKRASLHSR